jgi:hypothetical protein
MGASDGAFGASVDAGVDVVLLQDTIAASAIATAKPLVQVRALTKEDVAFGR